jgi:hypothetical protein
MACSSDTTVMPDSGNRGPLSGVFMGVLPGILLCLSDRPGFPGDVGPKRMV